MEGSDSYPRLSELRSLCQNDRVTPEAIGVSRDRDFGIDVTLILVAYQAKDLNATGEAIDRVRTDVVLEPSLIASSRVS